MFYVNNYEGIGETIASCNDLELAKVCAEWQREQARLAKVTIPCIYIMDEHENIVASYKRDCAIEDMDLSVRSYNCLKRAGIGWVSELMKMSIADIRSIRNLGPRCTAEVLNKMAEFIVEG